MLGVGAWRTRDRQRGNALLPLPVGDMDWDLTDHRGQPVRPLDWVGRPVMAFFGFTWCPDVCPTTLNDISLWLEELGPDADRLVVALITVDPDRDTPEALADYVSNFDPRIIGLTGSAEQVEKAAADFRVKYARVPRDDGDYTMDHTAGVFLFHPDGRFASIIDFHEDRRFAVPKIRRTLS
ncbi:SCO family protein [Defluviimonas denitrificans]|nr:SCO family protein [Defluviimonas denitrificans]